MRSSLCVLLLWLVGLAQATDPGSESIHVDRDDTFETVRGIFKERCISCHGSKRQRGGLRLDSRAAAFAGGDSGAPAIAPGAGNTSEIVRRIRSTDPELRMPLDRDALDEAEIQVLQRWIDAGAVWPNEEQIAQLEGSDHWAYQPWRNVRAPGGDETQQPIDQFVRKRLGREGLEPSPEADRRTLIRRLSFDLVGLPPTPDEVERFVADTNDDAYERLVERLLASHHFGERWGRHWLDLARYSDSDGAAFDNERSIWPYRDWVVEAFNRDLPFDRFTVLQLAGDLVPGAGRDDRVATGFHRNTMITEEDGVDDEEFRIEAVKNRVETTGTVWMGSTLNCAQCHDHKYDPFSTRDYYRTFAFFNNTEDRGRSQEPYLPLPTQAEALELNRIAKDIAGLRKQLNTSTPALRESQFRWEKELAVSDDLWHVVEPLRVSSNKGVELKVLGDTSILATGPSPDVATYAISATTELDRITAVRLEVLPDESLPRQGPGRTFYGNFVLTDFSVTATPLDDRLATSDTELKIAKATASYEQATRISNGPIAHAIDQDRGTGWGIFPEVGRRHEAIFVFENPIGFEDGTLLNFELEQGIGNEHTLGRFRLSLTTAPKPPRARPSLTPELDEIRRKPAAARTVDETAPLEAHFLSLATELDPLREEIERLEAQRPIPAKTLVMMERSEPRPTHVLVRGDFLRPGARVEAGVPAFLAVPFGKQGTGETTRLGLARWLVSSANALTARVTVNRFWQQLFGRGIVETSNDFGTRGTPPSHPDLLEWLARSFVNDGWSMKGLLRRMVRSKTYRQSSLASPQLVARDPNNVLLARQTRLRLEGEAIRDAALVASGLLVADIGGPPVHPPLTKGGNLGRATPKQWVTSRAPDRFRRSLYTWNWRTSPYPFYATFDAPPATVPCSRRQRANTPLQALMMANDPMMLEIAGGLGRRILQSGGADDEERLVSAFGWCFSRAPEPNERTILLGFLERQRASFQQAPEAATMLAGMDDATSQTSAAASEVAAWTALTRVLLNLDEFVSRD